MSKLNAVRAHGANIFTVSNDANESCNIVRVDRGQWKVVCFDDVDTVIHRSFHTNKREATIYAKEWLKLDANTLARGAAAITATYAIIDGKQD